MVCQKVWWHIFFEIFFAVKYVLMVLDG